MTGQSASQRNFRGRCASAFSKEKNVRIVSHQLFESALIGNASGFADLDLNHIRFLNFNRIFERYNFSAGRGKNPLKQSMN